MSNQTKDTKNSNQKDDTKKESDTSMLKERSFVVNNDESKQSKGKK